MATELELKLAVGDLHLLDCILCSPDVRSRMHGDFTYLQTESTYFDTPDGKLAARHWALRLRKFAGKSVVTIKTPGDGLARGEWETEAEYLEDAVPRLVKDGAPAELADILQSGVLAPILVSSRAGRAAPRCASWSWSSKRATPRRCWHTAERWRKNSGCARSTAANPSARGGSNRYKEDHPAWRQRIRS